jgi:hypothetical protein
LAKVWPGTSTKISQRPLPETDIYCIKSNITKVQSAFSVGLLVIIFILISITTFAKA